MLVSLLIFQTKFEYLIHDLLIVKLHVFEYDQQSLKFIYTCLCKMVQVTHNGPSYNEISDIT